jgi:lysophospholipase L1-like esterase
MRNPSGILWLLFFSLPLPAGCGKPPRPEYLDEDALIIAFGDSLTRGFGAGKEENYPVVLEQLSGRRVINAGVPGELSAKGRKRLPKLLNKHKPDLLILCHGGNDILRRRPSRETGENLRVMIREARKREIEVVLIGVPEFANLLMESAPFYALLAKEFAIPIEDEILPEVESDAGLKSDRIHPNGLGYRLMVEAIHRLLIERGVALFTQQVNI